MRELYLVIAYDTPDDRRRARLAKLLKGFGERRQYSVFEARLTREQWAHLKGKLEALVNKEEDVLAVYFLPPEAVGRTWRIGHEGLKRLEDPDFVSRARRPPYANPLCQTGGFCCTEGCSFELHTCSFPSCACALVLEKESPTLVPRLLFQVDA